MNETQPPDTGLPTPELPSANPGYALGQLARALTTSQTHPDTGTRERAAQKIERWIKVFQGMLSGSLAIGSRTPVAATPAWATLEVVKGGFATGALLAEGPLQPHEHALLQELPAVEAGAERAAINHYYLTDQGFAALQDMLTHGRYQIRVPEEGALLVIAWLARQRHLEQAQALLELLGPFLRRLRFYPLPASHPIEPSTTVYRQPVEQTITDLLAVRVRRSIACEREALLVWAPLYDRAVTLYIETVAGTIPHVPFGPDGMPLRNPAGQYRIAGGWPCQHYPAGWAERVQLLLDDYTRQRDLHQLSEKPERPTENFARLRNLLARCCTDPAQLTGREVGQVRAILATYTLKRGLPGSARHQELRQAQQQRATLPTTTDYARVVVRRLKPLPQDEGLADLSAVSMPITAEEAIALKLPEGEPIPPVLERTLERCLAAPVELLVERRILPSSEALARVVPQLSAYTRVASIADQDLRWLYSELYTAFRRRRSLLLFNLQHQVRFGELPWVRAIEPYCEPDEQVRGQAQNVLRQVVTLALSAFPQQILPNTLLREISTLAESGGLVLPIVDELAADIFMGEFSQKYLHAAQQAGKLLNGTLYERYYAIDYAQVLQIDDVLPSRYGTPTSPAFVRLCHERAGATQSASRRSVARNGTVIEQEQILTTHNLAVLFDVLDLTEGLRPQLPDMAVRCFTWVCNQLQGQHTPGRSQLRVFKNSAYAWRQMVFFLALLQNEQVIAFLEWAEEYLGEQPAAFRQRFWPALAGLHYAAAGHPVVLPARRLLGWTIERHWLSQESA